MCVRYQNRLSGQSDGAQMMFMRRWMTSHSTDSKTILKKPLVLAEFGKSSKDPGYSLYARESFMAAIYGNIYRFARRGGIAGGLVWQILAEGMQPYADGYEIVLSQNPSTGRIISQQSRQITSLDHMVSNRTNSQSNKLRNSKEQWSVFQKVYLSLFVCQNQVSTIEISIIFGVF